MFRPRLEGFAPSDWAAGMSRSTKSSHSIYSGRLPLIASSNRVWIARVTSPGGPSTWSSTSRTGTTSAAVPVRKSSSA